MANSLIGIGAESFRTQLLTNASLVTEITKSDGEIAIYATQVRHEQSLPWIRMTHLLGGEDNLSPSRSFDMVWRIECIAETQVKADEIAGYIDEALTGSYPTMPTGWAAWANITRVIAFSEMLNFEKNQFWAIGAQYRLRGGQTT